MALANVSNANFSGSTPTQIVACGISSSSGGNNWIAVGLATPTGIILNLVDSTTYVNIVTPLTLPSTVGYIFSYIGFNSVIGALNFAITNGTSTILYNTNIGLFITTGRFITEGDLTQLTETNMTTLPSPITTVNDLTSDGGAHIYFVTTNSTGTNFAEQWTFPTFGGSSAVYAQVGSITFNPLSSDPNTFTTTLYDRPNKFYYAVASMLGAVPTLVVVKIAESTFSISSTLNLGAITAPSLPVNSSAIDCSFMYLVQTTGAGLVVTKIDLSTFAVVNSLTIAGTTSTFITAQSSAVLLPDHLLIAAYDTSTTVSHIFDVNTDTFTQVDDLTVTGATSVQGLLSTFDNNGYTTMQPDTLYKFSGTTPGGSGQYQGGGGNNTQGVPPNYGLPTTLCTGCETVIPDTQSVCSLVGDQLVILNIINNTDCNIDVEWQSYNQAPFSCQKVYYQTVTANNNGQVQSYVSHPWKFYLNNTNQLIFQLPPLSGNTTVTFNCNSTVVSTSPIILAIYPAIADSGDTITIYGYGFTGVTSISINGTPVTTYTILNDNAIQILIPVGATTGRIQLNGSFGSVSSPEDAIVHPPYAPELTQVVVV